MSETVGDMATSIESMAKVARDAEYWLLQLVGQADATRESLQAGQRSADFLGKVNIFVGGAIAVLTVVLVVLTWVLLQDPHA